MGRSASDLVAQPLARLKEATRIVLLLTLGDAVGQIVEDVQPGDAFLREQVQGVAPILTKHRHQDLASFNHLLVGRKRMDGGPLQQPLDADGPLKIASHPHGKFLFGVLEKRLGQPRRTRSLSR